MAPHTWQAKPHYLPTELLKKVTKLCLKGQKKEVTWQTVVEQERSSTAKGTGNRLLPLITLWPIVITQAW
jgi:hypothetical protein